MLTSYPACFFKEDDGYSVVFPDLNWLSTCGNSLEEAFSMAIDCLAGHLFFCEKEGITAGTASPLKDIDAADVAAELEIEPKEMFVNMVSVDVAAYAKLHFEKSVKKTLTIPSWLNTMAMDQNINFSQVLQEALKAKLHVD